MCLSQGAHERCDITGGWRVFTAANAFQAGDEISVKHKGGNVIQVRRPRGQMVTAQRQPGTAGADALGACRAMLGMRVVQGHAVCQLHAPWVGA